MTKTPALATESTTPELDGPICVVSSPYALVSMCVVSSPCGPIHLFSGVGELGLCAFLFSFGIVIDPTCILATSSIIVTGLFGDSCSLEISTIYGLLCMVHQFLSRINNHAPSLVLVTSSISSFFLNNSLYHLAVLQLNSTLHNGVF